MTKPVVSSDTKDVKRRPPRSLASIAASLSSIHSRTAALAKEMHEATGNLIVALEGEIKQSQPSSQPVTSLTHIDLKY